MRRSGMMPKTAEAGESACPIFSTSEIVSVASKLPILFVSILRLLGDLLCS
jgi:hypothetical protein